MLALQDLVHALGLRVILVDNLIITFVDDFALTQHVVFGFANALGPHVDVEVHRLLLLDLALQIILVETVHRGLFLVLANHWVTVHWVELLTFVLALLQLHQHLLRSDVHSLVLCANHAHCVGLAFDFV